MMSRTGRWAAVVFGAVAATVLLGADDARAQARGGMCGPCMCMGGGMQRTSMMGGGMMPRMGVANPALYSMQLRQQQAALLTAMQGQQQMNALWWPQQQFQFNPWAPAAQPQQQKVQLRGN